MTELIFLKVLMLIRQLHQECNICHYLYFVDNLFKFQAYVCNGCHTSMMSMRYIDIAILNICGIDYCYINNGISKNKAVNLLQNAHLSKKSKSLQIFFYLIFFFKLNTCSKGFQTTIRHLTWSALEQWFVANCCCQALHLRCLQEFLIHLRT